MRRSFNIKLLIGMAVIMMSLCSTDAFGQKISVKTNALGWAALTPNFGFEIVTGERSTVDLVVMGHIRPYGFDSKAFSVQPEYRYWFGGRPMIHTFVGATAIFAMYNTVLREQVRDGYAAGLGVTVGYVLPMGKKWNVEFSGGFSLLSYFQKQYHVDDVMDHFINIPTKINSMGYKMLPVDIGVSFTYIIK